MKKVSLLFGIHMHQPVDNFDEAVNEAVELCYEPFFETMIKYPKFKFAVHSSGWLLEQIRTKHPKVFQNMKKLSEQGSIEWVSAGFYEPVLSSIPSRDRQTQITKLSNYIKEHFNTTPKGLWLTERVWESAIVPDLNKISIDYAMVDDYHFLSSGFEHSNMDGYYKTEEGGYELALFPISKKLRYALPFYTVDRAIDTILEFSKEDDSAAIIFDDAEKFGLWPKTHKWVYEQEWLKKFIEAVLENKFIQTQHYSEYLKNNRSKGLAYLNNTSYFEMGEWSLRSEQTLALEELKQNLGDEYFEKVGIALVKGGTWKNFFIKYHESNYLHKRMLSLSLKQELLEPDFIESLYKAQTNDVYWHGVFGGLYLPNLRDNAYKYILEIEKSLSKDSILYNFEDINKDGYSELKVLSKSLCSIFSSRWGGQMIEFSTLDSLFNWQNTLMRRKEAYHEKILNPKEEVELEADQNDDGIETIHNTNDVIEEDLKEELVYDWHPKHSFIDHFSQNTFELDSFKKLTFREVGDFANNHFDLDKNTNTFTRRGGIYLDEPYRCEVTKNYDFINNGFTLNFNCTTDYKEKLFYASECNFHFAHPYNVIINNQKVQSGLTLEDVDSLHIIDSFTQKKIELKFSQKCNIYAYILNTVSLSESGFDKVAQQISFLFSLPFESKLNLQIDVGVSNV
ncbi:alpha-amylase/4-alpha-glucanotransferase domain-containing protein [Sulfurimonas sp.]|uniref:alpha-amylase/4-alpha-glucanotransferase domain-containing protein n=1 Tax=Sulfurimonas sp. TaxID=2022749 RepID=UPI003561D375